MPIKLREQETLGRLLDKTVPLKNGCLEYVGTKTKNGTLRQHSYKGKMWPASRLSWMLQKGKIPKNWVVCHRCDYPPCVNIDHLFIGTHKDNTQDASKKFRLIHGENHWWHKLKESDVILMRKLWVTGFWTYAALGRKFFVNESTSARIIKGKLWKHLLAVA